MISITLEELVNSTDALRELSQKNLRARASYHAGKILKAAEAEMQSFNETRMELIRKYAEKDENGELKSNEDGNVNIMKEHLATFTQELNELLAANVEINAEPINIDDIENVEFTPGAMAQLEKFISVE